MKLNVALLNDQLNAGGAEKVMITIANLLHDKDINVTVILFLDKSDIDEQLHKDIPVFYLRRQGRFDLKAMKLLKHHCGKADIVHIHSRYNLRYFMVAKYLTAIHKPKIVFHEHVPVLSVDAFTKLLFHKLDAYLAVLNSMCAWAKQQKVADDKIYYLPNIVSPPVAPVKYSSARKKRIMMAGNIWSFKNQTFAVDLLKNLDKDYTLDIYGGINDRTYYHTLTNLITKHKLFGRINIIHGVNDIYAVTGNYDFAIHTSTHETGPLVLLEYMYAQLPFLTYATGDVVSYIAPRLPEFIMHTFSIDDWRMRIENVMTDEDTLNKARHTMRCIIKEHCSPEAYYKKLSGIYKAVLTKA